MKAVVAAFNQEKALVGAFSVITNVRMELFGEITAHWAMGPSKSAAEAHLNAGFLPPLILAAPARD